MQDSIHPKASREAWIDIAKGIGILLVILGHLPIPLPLLMLLRSFNMPCFFFVSGLLFPGAKSWKAFAHSKALSLLKPYLYFSLISFCVWLLLRPFSNTAQGVDPFSTLLAIPYATNQAGMFLAYNMPLWFLPCLFCASMLFMGLSRLPRIPCISASLGIALVGYHWPDWFMVRPPWSLDVAMAALPFMTLGYLWRQSFIHAPALPWRTLLLLGLLNALACFCNTPVDMNFAHYGNLLMFGLAACAGLLCLTNLAKHLAPYQPLRQLLTPLGKNSLYILGFHGLAYNLLNGLRHKLLSHLPVLHGVGHHVSHHLTRHLSHVQLTGQALLSGGSHIAGSVLTFALYIGVGLLLSRQAKYLLSPYFHQSVS